MDTEAALVMIILLLTVCVLLYGVLMKLREINDGLRQLKENNKP